MRSARAFLHTWGLLVLAAAVSAAGQFVIVWSIARTRGVTPLGVYGLVTSLKYLAQNLFTSGLQPLIMLRVAREHGTLGRSMGTALLGITVLGIPLAGLVVILATILGHLPPVILTIAIASVALVPDAIRSAVEWTALSLGRIRYAVLTTVSASLLQILVVGIVLLTHGSLLVIFGAITLVSTFVAGVSLGFLIRWVRPRRLGTSPAELANWIRLLAPFLGFGAFGSLSRSLDVPLLTQFGGFDATGIYTAALKMVRPLVLLRPALFQAFFPAFARQFDERPETSLRMAATIMRVSSVALSVVALVTVAWANPLIAGVYGADFAPTIPVLQIMVWGVPAFYGQALVSSILFASDREKAAMRIHGVSLVTEVCLSLVLVPAWGAVGMAVVYVVTRMAGMVQGWMALRKRHGELRLGQVFFGPLLLAGVGGLALALTTWAIPGVVRLAAGAITAVLYGFAAIALGLVRKRDLVLLLGALRRQPRQG